MAGSSHLYCPRRHSTRVAPRPACVLQVACAAAALAWSGSLAAQTVQFPTPAPGAAPPTNMSPYGAPTYGTPAYGAPTYGAPAPTTPAPAAPGYGAPAYGAPTYGGVPGSPPAAAQPAYAPPAAPGYTAPGYAAPTYAPPTFDPYGGAGGSWNAAPAAPAYGANPYGYAAPQYGAPAGAANPSLFQPPPSGAYPPQPGGMYPNGAPVGWESGSYQWQNPDGTVVRVQRLLQQFTYEQTWIAGKHEPGQLEINRTELAATFGLPMCGNPDTPLLITPGFAFNWLKGPVSDLDPVTGLPVPGSPDLPPRLYDAYVDFAWHPKLGNWLSADLGFRTGVWTDFDSVTSESVRYLGRGLGVIAVSPRLDLLAGVWYLDRNDIKLLPAGGLYWRPTPEWDIYAVFPNPKARKKFVSVGPSQWWWYVAGEYGGGRWTLTRAGGIPDDIDYNDYRVMFGFEWETQSQAHGHIEVGYVWNREILFARTQSPPFLDLEDTVMVRAGIDF